MKHGYIAMLLWASLMATGCGTDDGQAKLQSCVAEQGKLQAENGTLQSQLAGLKNELENLGRRKDVIYSMKMVVDFTGLQGPAAPAGGPATTSQTICVSIHGAIRKKARK